MDLEIRADYEAKKKKGSFFYFSWELFCRSNTNAALSLLLWLLKRSNYTRETYQNRFSWNVHIISRPGTNKGASTIL